MGAASRVRVMLQVLGEGAVVGADQGVGSRPRHCSSEAAALPSPSTAGMSPHVKGCLLESGEEGGLGATACAMTGHEVSPTAELSLSTQPRSVLGERDKAGVHPCWEEGALEVECPPQRQVGA